MRRVINITITLMAIVSLSPAQVTQTYNYTGNYETFSVPDCVSEITIICYGASGFAGQGSSAGAKGGDAGLGAMISGIFAAKPGQQLYLFVGGAASGRNGGYNGGGMGASAGHHGGGGGATDVRLNGVAPENRIIIAGGGGGGGLAGCTAGDYHGGRGGAGGGGYGGDGVSAVNGGQGGTGGHGATAGLPGTGCAPAYLGQAGTGGSAHGMGGTGGLQSGGINFCQAVGLNEGGGGGGGGGYVGGGGGGGGGGSSSQCNTVNTGSSGGGAGGTNYTSNDFSNVTETAGGAPAGNGKIVITYYINPTPDAPAGLFSQTFCNSATISDLQANGDDLKWYAAATGGNEIQYSAGVSQGNTYYTSQTVNNCESSERLPVNVTLNIPAPPTGEDLQNFCNSATVADLQASGATVKWYDAATDGVAFDADTELTNKSYYASQTLDGCESQDRLAVTVSISQPDAPLGDELQTVCNKGTLTDLVASGANIRWYDAANGGAAFDADTEVTNRSYYASQMLDGCEGQDRLAVTVSISQPDAPLGDELQTICDRGSLVDLKVEGISIQWHDAAMGGNYLDPGTLLIDGTRYYASQVIGLCESKQRLAVEAHIADAIADADVIVVDNTLTAQITGVTYEWIDCVTGAAISGETRKQFVAQRSGRYALRISNSCGSNTGDCFNLIVTATEIEEEHTPIRVYPNPSVGSVTIKAGRVGKTYLLVNAQGVTMQTGIVRGETVVDMNAMRPGVYLLKIEEAVVKLIKQ